MKNLIIALGFLAILSTTTIDAYYKTGKNSKYSATPGILSELEEEVEEIIGY